MLKEYTKENYELLLAKKKKMFTSYWIVIGIVFAVFLTIFIYFLTRPFGWEYETLTLIIEITISSLSIILSFLFFIIPYGRVNSYCKLYDDILNATHIYSECTVLGYEEHLFNKNGVDFYRLNVMEWSDLERDYVERSILVDNEIKNLPLKKGDMIEVETYSNVLCGYKLNFEGAN